MSREDQIDDLIDEILESGRSPDEVCVQHPELVAEVRERLRKLRSIQAQVDSLFPASVLQERTLHHVPASGDAPFPAIPDHDVQLVLGRGGMGIVYKALHLKLNRQVALKMLLTGSYASRQEHLRFVREAEAVAALRHPNIVQIYEFGEVEGHPFYTMEFVGGGSLAEKLGGAVQPARESAKLVSTLARAVQAAHEAGMVHRDLKPANVLLGGDEEPKITDFGLARRLDRDSELTNTGARIGTPSYMAPEQMLGHPAALGRGVDVFALGAILYEMLTGRPPFRGESLSDTERRLANEDATWPSRINAKVPRDLETICLKCLEKDPHQRYASAGELADDLDRFLRHEPILARPVPPAERWARWVRRNPLPTALAVTLILLAALIASQTTREWTEAAADRAEKSRLTARLESGVQLVQDGRFAEARAILGKLGDGGFPDLRQRIDRVLSDLDRVERLEVIGIKRAMALSLPDVTWQPDARAAKEYEALFVRTGIGRMSDAPVAIAKRIEASDIETPLVAALDDWAVCEADATRRNWVLDVARLADPGAPAWVRQCRDPATWNDREVLTRLAATAAATKPAVLQLRALGDRLAAAGLDATAFRMQVQQQHVDSFLANLTLADALRPTDQAEAIRYYQAALAIRPGSATAHNNLAVALASLSRTDEARAHLKQSAELDANSAAPQFNLGAALAQDHPGAAIGHLQRAIERNPEFAAAHRLLGELLLQEHRYADAAAALRTCRELVSDEGERGQIDALIERCDAQSSATPSQ